MATVLSPWKRRLLGAYYYATLAGRCWRNRSAALAGKAPVMIVFYHRVADQFPNDWTISRHDFTRQIDWLERRFDIVSLAEAQQRLRDGNTQPSVSITFDDGYAENCDFALPLLLSRQIPCTYFVASQFAISGEPFPHDVAAGNPLPPNTIEQLRALADNGIEIGGHTRTHADLGSITDRDRLRDEVVGSRQDLEDTVGCAIRYFAFPYGLRENLNADVFDLAQRENFDGVCSAYGDYNFPGADPFHLRRIHADPEFVRFRNWLTVDRRKLARGNHDGIER
jgi:peptidoglycan/xylan/chitin deacetylase (PgdA/CDA1 family)